MKRYFKNYSDKQLVDCGIDYHLITKMKNETDSPASESTIIFTYPDDYIYSDDTPPKTLTMTVITEHANMVALLKEIHFTHGKDM